MNIYLKTLTKKYADFSGRASQKEFWTFILFQFLVFLGPSFVLGIVSGVYKDLFGPNVQLRIAITNALSTIISLYFLCTLIPFLAVSARRLHDVDQSGWLLLLHLVCCVGWIALFIFHLKDGRLGPNQYGPDPRKQKPKRMPDEFGEIELTQDDLVDE